MSPRISIITPSYQQAAFLGVGAQAAAEEVAAAQACSFDRDFTLQCDGGEWQIETNCGTNVQACTLIDAGDDPSCTRDDGCIVCR